MQRLHEERANALLERRAADNADELAELESAVTAAKAALAKGGGRRAQLQLPQLQRLEMDAVARFPNSMSLVGT